MNHTVDLTNFGLSAAMLRTMAERLTGSEFKPYRDRLRVLADVLDPHHAEALPSPEQQQRRRERMLDLGNVLSENGLDVEAQDPDTLEHLDGSGRLLGVTRWTGGVPVFTPVDADGQWSALTRLDAAEGDDDDEQG